LIQCVTGERPTNANVRAAVISLRKERSDVRDEPVCEWKFFDCRCTHQSYVVNLRAGNSSQLALAGLSTFGAGGVV
jgi:hypothetical protein